MITTFNPFQLIGSLTVEQALSTVRSLLNEQDNQRIQDLSVRMFLNSAKHELHEKLIATSFPLYDYIFHAKAEQIVYVSTQESVDNVDYEELNNAFTGGQLNNTFRMLEIDLGAAVTIDRDYIDLTPSTPGVVSNFYGMSSIRPIEYLYSVKNVSILGHGVGKQLDYASLMSLAHTETDIHNNSFYWAFVGTKILIMPGRKLLDVADRHEYDHFFEDATYEIHSVRKPLLDDLLHPLMSVTYTRPLDLPNTQYSSLFLAVQKSCLESLQKLALPQLDQSIDAAVQTKVQAVLTNKQLGAI